MLKGKAKVNFLFLEEVTPESMEKTVSDTRNAHFSYKWRLCSAAKILKDLTAQAGSVFCREPAKQIF